MPAFVFDHNKLPRENLAAFQLYLLELDAALAPLLSAALSELTPLPEPGAARNSLRARANRAVCAELAARRAVVHPEGDE